MLRIVYTTIRVGLLLVVLSGFGYLLMFRLQGFEERLYSHRLWAKLILTVILLVNAILLQLRRVPLWFGGAVSLVSWYAALVLGAWRTMKLSDGWLVVGYVALVGLASALMKARDRPPMPQKKTV